MQKKRRERLSNAIEKLRNLLPDQAVSTTKNVVRPGARISQSNVVEAAVSFIIALMEENTRLLRVTEQNPPSEGLQTTPDTTTPSVELDSGPAAAGDGPDSRMKEEKQVVPGPAVRPGTVSTHSRVDTAGKEPLRETGVMEMAQFEKLGDMLEEMEWLDPDAREYYTLFL